MRNWLVELRKMKGLNQRKLAALAGISPNYLCEIEKGTRNPSGQIALRLSAILEIDMARFYAGYQVPDKKTFTA